VYSELRSRLLTLVPVHDQPGALLVVELSDGVERLPEHLDARGRQHGEHRRLIPLAEEFDGFVVLGDRARHPHFAGRSGHVELASLRVLVTSLSSYPLVERRVRDRRGARGELGRLAGGDVERGTAGEPERGLRRR